MRIPYLQNPPKFENADDSAIMERLKERRGKIGLLNVDLTLLHAPLIAAGWYVQTGQLLLPY